MLPPGPSHLHLCPWAPQKQTRLFCCNSMPVSGDVFLGYSYVSCKHHLGLVSVLENRDVVEIHGDGQLLIPHLLCAALSILLPPCSALLISVLSSLAMITVHPIIGCKLSALCFTIGPLSVPTSSPMGFSLFRYSCQVCQPVGRLLQHNVTSFPPCPNLFIAWSKAVPQFPQVIAAICHLFASWSINYMFRTLNSPHHRTIEKQSLRRLSSSTHCSRQDHRSCPIQVLV